VISVPKKAASTSPLRNPKAAGLEPATRNYVLLTNDDETVLKLKIADIL
jgi:hypothetical protein